MALVGITWPDESDSDSESSSSDEESGASGGPSDMDEDEGESDEMNEGEGVTHVDGSALPTMPEVHMDGSDGGQDDEVRPNIENVEV